MVHSDFLTFLNGNLENAQIYVRIPNNFSSDFRIPGNDHPRIRTSRVVWYSNVDFVTFSGNSCSESTVFFAGFWVKITDIFGKNHQKRGHFRQETDQESPENVTF